MNVVRLGYCIHVSLTLVGDERDACKLSAQSIQLTTRHRTRTTNKQLAWRFRLGLGRWGQKTKIQNKTYAVPVQGWVVHRVTFFPRKHFCRLKSSQLCSPAPVDGIRAQDRSFSCTSASVPFRGPETDPRSVLGRSEITEIVTRSSGDPGQQDVAS